jgi:hypothetical protein
MSTEIAAIVGLAVMFIIATVLPINMGALAFVGAFIIGLLSHMSAKDIFAGFPETCSSRSSVSLTSGRASSPD